MNILVTGGLGHIGSKLIRDLTKRDDVNTIRILDNLLVQRYCSLFDLPTSKKYEFIEGDITKKDDVDKAMKDIDTVVHLAAITDAANSFEVKELVEKVNVGGTKNVVESALNHNVKKLFYPSTTSVYGPMGGIAKEDCSEEDLKPQSPYAENKLKGENIILKAAKENGLNGTVCRFGTVAGTSIGMRFHTAVNKFVYSACYNTPLTIWDSALQHKRPYLDLRDSINAILFSMDNKKTNGELFNIVNINASIQEIVDNIKEFVPDLKVTITKSPLLNQMSYVVDDSKIRNLGFEYIGNLRESIKNTVKLLRPDLF
jgi:UDP-glucose 4-epimerase